MTLRYAKDLILTSFVEETRPRLLAVSDISSVFGQPGQELQAQEDSLELILVRTGSGTYLVNTERFEVKAGMILVCNQGIRCHEIPKVGHHLSVMRISIDDVWVKGLPRNHLIPVGVKPVLEVGTDFTMMDAMFRSIYDSLADGKEDQREKAFYMTQALLSCILHLFRESGSPASGEVRRDSLSLLSEIKHYIDNNYTKKLSLTDISEYFFISPSYLSHLFKRELGYSPMQYIVKRRIEKAQVLLAFTGKTVTEIAADVGFNSPSHFNVQFKKQVGESPLEYRKHNWNGS